MRPTRSLLLLSALLLREPLTAVQILGGAMILLFTFLSERGSVKSVKGASP